MEKLALDEIGNIFNELCEILEVKAALFLPEMGQSEEYLWRRQLYEFDMGGTLGEAFALGKKYGAVILNLDGIHDYFYGSGHFKNKKISDWVDRGYIPKNLKAAYALIIIHELTHIQEFMDAGLIEQNEIDFQIVEDLFVKQVKAFNKFLGGSIARDKLAEELGMTRVHKDDFNNRYLKNITRTKSVINKLEEEV